MWEPLCAPPGPPTMLGDRLQIWEINTNPNVGSSTFLDDTERKAMVNRRFEHFAAAIAEIDVEDAAHEPAPPESPSS